MSTKQTKKPTTGSSNDNLTAPGASDIIINNNLRINLAIILLTLLTTVFCLYVLNYCIYTLYTPDISAILTHILPLAVVPPEDFYPEPVERLQYQLSILTTPLFVFAAYTLIHKAKGYFQKNTSTAFMVNMGVFVAFLIYVIALLKGKLICMPDTTNTIFFEKNLIGSLDPFVGILCYAAFTYLVIIYLKAERLRFKKPMVLAVSIVTYAIVAVVIYDLYLYDIFNLEVQSWDRLMETNAVFYSITQVFAGKSLLVNVNAQYGMYALFLLPVFKIIGMSAYKFGVVMGVLNGGAFLLFYLGIKKLIKQDVISMLVFLCLVFWQFWQIRLPLEATPRYYYQYDPIRMVFPSITFFLFVTCQAATLNVRRILIPLLALCAACAIFWNADTGIVTYGATFVGLLYSGIDTSSLKDSVKRCSKYAAWMIGAFLFVLLMFMLITKTRSGLWPDFKQFFAYQKLYYVSGFYMIPMIALHFWNITALTYVAACVYCMYHLKKIKTPEAGTIAYLFVLGAGLFVYFEGRSWDTNVCLVMHPAIICLGIFCNKMQARIQSAGIFRLKMHEIILFFAVPFMFITDGAFSMLSHLPSTHALVTENNNPTIPPNSRVEQKISFLKANVAEKDTVLILAFNNEGYYYAAGHYYNPMNLVSSTEILLASDFNSILDTVRNTKHPIIYDADHPMIFNRNNQGLYHNALIKALAQNTTMRKRLPSDSSMLLLTHGKDYVDKLKPDANTVYYNSDGEFNKLLRPSEKITLPDNFTMELVITLGKYKTAKNSALFSNINNSFEGFAIAQYGDNDAQYRFAYGNGSAWVNGAVFMLDSTAENHLSITMNNNLITATCNGKTYPPTPAVGKVKNSGDLFFFNRNFTGTVWELKISKL